MKRVRRSLLLSRSAVTAALVIALLLVVGTAALTAFSTYDVAKADQRAIKADEALSAASEMLATLDEMEVAAQVYTSSADRNFLPAYEKAREFLTADFTELRQQLEERGPVTPLLTELQARVVEKIQEIEQSIQTTTTSSQPLSINPAERVASARLSADIRELAHALQRQELAGVADKSTTAISRAQTIQSLNLSLLAIAVSLVLAGAWVMWQRMREFDSLITICAWTQRVWWQGRWVSFEDFLAKRFNVSCTHGICDEMAEKMRRELDDEAPIELASALASSHRGSTK